MNTVQLGNATRTGKPDYLAVLSFYSGRFGSGESEMTKVCTTCKEVKPEAMFYRAKKYRDGRQPKCVSCCQQYNKDNKERIQSQRKEYYAEHREDILAEKRDYTKNSASKIAERKKKYYQENPEKLKTIRDRSSEKVKAKRDAARKEKDKITPKPAEGHKFCTVCNVEQLLSNFQRNRTKPLGVNSECKICRKTYMANTKERTEETRKKWVLATKDARLKYDSEYRKKRKESDPLFKFKLQTRSFIHDALRRSVVAKGSSTEQILGCSYQELMQHLEVSFQQGMSWENRSEWHIDHKIPLASAKTEEDVIRLNHYTNLQPLWAKDNLRKGSKMPEVYKGKE
jgi:transposase-like protein